jgi:hypothetical protein
VNTITADNEVNMDKFIIPDEMPKFKKFDFDGFTMREEYLKEGMFAFVSWKWVNPFAEWINNRKCLEVMAGRGILSLALRQKGIDIIATDDFSWSEMDAFKKWKTTVTEVERLDAVESVVKYGEYIDILIMSWPYMDDTAYKVIRKLNEANPHALVVYIGEGYGGCTANDDFFEHFNEIDDESFKVVVKNFERWFGLHDSPRLGKYK